ncbi:MAG: hypothetical protein A4E63_01802 [Syntrophorhabdus sp. PtaU1.Bin050]|nr:MAG: hypothetical protein A4E63_01802 [Syntrophorhabdus sp. PtaU1.Bin050]
MCNPGIRILLFVAGCALLWFGFSGLSSGQVYVKGGRFIHRDESPINYWLNVGTYLIAGTSGVGCSLFL